MPRDAKAVMCFGDSISDGSGSTLNGDDRWPDVLSRRLHAVHGNRVAVVNGGIGGNQIIGPAVYSTSDPTVGGPSALARLERDVIRMPGISTVIWLEGINDFGLGGAAVPDVWAGIQTGVTRMRDGMAGVRILLGTLTPALGATTNGHGTAEVDAKRRELNTLIRTCRIADGVIDFDAMACDPATGKLRAEMVPGSSIGGPGDWLHPNRIGYQAMGAGIDLKAIVP